MKYLKFTYVDSATGVPVTDAPAANGPTFPAVDGIVFEWARESQYPTEVPEFFGTCPDDSFVMVPGVIDVIPQADWEAMREGEMTLRTDLLRRSIVNATQARLDAFAQTRNYDGILSLCTYATSPTAKFAAEGQYAVLRRDDTWATLYTILAEVEAGTRAMPTGYADVEPELPVLVWPA